MAGKLAQENHATSEKHVTMVSFWLLHNRYLWYF